MQNLIENPDFTAPYQFPSSGNEDVRIVRGLDLIPFRAPNIRVPTGFLAFTYDDSEYVTVEMGLGETPERLFDGHPSVKYFVAGHPHDAGLAQTLLLDPGVYQFRAWAHGWSNHNIAGARPGEKYESCNNDGLCSVGVGRGPYFELEGTIGEPNGEPWHDAKFNMLFLLGVTMGEFVSPSSDHVTWGQGAYIYNIFHELPLLEFEVKEERLVTVYVRSVTRWGFRNADAYIGKMELVKVENVEDECWGQPREQYKRTYVLTPPGMSVDDKHSLLDKFPNFTIGPSADDAGLGALDDKTVIAVNPYEWDDSLRDFFIKHYPGTRYVEFELNPAPIDVHLWQCDPQWKDEKVMGNNCELTLCQTGCWITNCASAQRYLGIKSDATPSTVNNALGIYGFTGCKATWAAMENKLGLHVEKRTDSEYEASLWLDGQPDHCAFAEVAPGEDLHFLFVERYSDEEGFYCHDPYHDRVGELHDLYPYGAESWRLIRRADEGPIPPTPPTPPSPPGPQYSYNPMPIISLHVQGNYVDEHGYGIVEWARDVKPAAIKFVDEVERARAIKAVSPNTITIGRFFRANQNRYWKDIEPEIGAVNFLDEITDTLRNVPELDYIESLNEVIECGKPWQNDRVARFDAKLAYTMQERGLTQKLVAQSAGVGNPYRQEDGVKYPEYANKSDLELMLPAVEAVCNTGGALGPHIYHPVIDGVTDWNQAWPYYAGRPLDSWDKVFTAHGYYPCYIFGEAGAIRSDSHYSLKPNDGWKMCYNLERMQDDLDVLAHKYRMWNKTHGNRVIAILLFTFAGFGVWENFEYKNVYRRMRWAEW